MTVFTTNIPYSKATCTAEQGMSHCSPWEPTENYHDKGIYGGKVRNMEFLVIFDILMSNFLPPASCEALCMIVYVCLSVCV